MEEVALHAVYQGLDDLSLIHVDEGAATLLHIAVVQIEAVSGCVFVVGRRHGGAQALPAGLNKALGQVAQHIAGQLPLHVRPAVDKAPLHRQPDDIRPGGGAGGQAQPGGQQEGGGGLGPLLPGGALLFPGPGQRVPLHGGHLPLIPGGGLKGGNILLGCLLHLLPYAVHQHVAHEPVQLLICHVCHGCIPSSCANFFSNSRPRAMRVFTAVWVRQSRWAISLLL